MASFAARKMRHVTPHTHTHTHTHTRARAHGTRIHTNAHTHKASSAARNSRRMTPYTHTDTHIHTDTPTRTHIQTQTSSSAVRNMRCVFVYFCQVTLLFETPILYINICVCVQVPCRNGVPQTRKMRHIKPHKQTHTRTHMRTYTHTRARIDSQESPER